jgi:hypothetical protein
MSYYPNVYAAQNGPLLLSGLDANFNFAVDIQSQSLYAAAGGSADVITATYTPAVTALVSGLTLYVKAAYANVTTTPTFSPNGLTARTIKKANNQALAAGDIAGAGHILILQYDAANTVWILANPQGLTFASDLNVYGLTIGRGAGAVASNTAVGLNTMANNSIGASNTGIGYATLNNNNTGNNNIAVGYSSLISNISGNSNVAVGSNSMLLSSTASFNTSLGYYSLNAITGSTNVAIGYLAGSSITTGSNNVVIGGYDGSTAPISATGSNWIVLSDGAGTVRQVINSSGNTGFGTTSPSASAIVDAQSTTKGVRMPNMTTTQKNAIASPAAGLMVFDTTLAKLCVYASGAWQTITSV